MPRTLGGMGSRSSCLHWTHETNSSLLISSATPSFIPRAKSQAFQIQHINPVIMISCYALTPTASFSSGMPSGSTCSRSSPELAPFFLDGSKSSINSSCHLQSHLTGLLYYNLLSCYHLYEELGWPVWRNCVAQGPTSWLHHQQIQYRYESLSLHRYHELIQLMG